MGELYVQMYSFFEDGKYDNESAFQAVKDMGYSGCELFGPNMGIPAEELKAKLEGLGIKAISLHQGVDQIEGLIPYAKTLGLAYMGIGMEVMDDAAQVHAFAKKLNEVGKKCRENGITLCYHNHTQEFLPCEDKTVFQVLMAETNPDYVSFELDAGWCAAAGANPLAVLEAYKGRIPLVHVKESDTIIWPQEPMRMKLGPDGNPEITPEKLAQMDKMRKSNCPACKGLVDWAELKKTADACGTKYYIVEREYSANGTRIETLTADYAAYSKIF